MDAAVDSEPMTEETPETGGWRERGGAPSLPEVHRSIAVPLSASFWRRLLAFIGPGYLVAVGYMDPGNWATDIAGGAKYNYRLLSVILISNFLAIFLQALAAKLGIVTGRDLAQACRDAYSKPVSHSAMAVGGNRDCRLRHRGSDRRGHRAQPAVPHPAHPGRDYHGAGRAAGAGIAAQGISLD